MWETRKMRQNLERPNFALEPTTYTLGGTFHRLTLTNEGQTVTDLKIDVSWGDKPEEKLKLYCISLSKGTMVHLDKVPIGEIKQNGKKITVNIICKDMGAKTSNSKLEIDFSSIVKDGREIAFQYDSEQSVASSISSISREIGSVERALGRLSESLRRIR
jgi:hypothetical protein